MDDAGFYDLLSTLSPTARDTLRRVLILDQPDRDAIASEPLRYGDQAGEDWADIIDALTMHRRGEGGYATGPRRSPRVVVP